LGVQQAAVKRCGHAGISLVCMSETSPVCLVHLVRLMQPNKPDRPNRPNEQDKLADSFSILLVSPCLAVPWFPPLGSPVLVKVDAVPHTARVPSQEFVVPDLAPGRKHLEPLGGNRIGGSSRPARSGRYWFRIHPLGGDCTTQGESRGSQEQGETMSMSLSYEQIAGTSYLSGT
jgi:hypothetical protein